jgi:hypothetical protein
MLPHLKADVVKFLSYRWNNREKNFNILMTHLKADVATFLSYRQNNRKKNFNILIIEVFFSYYSVCEEKMFPHQPLNGSLKY